MSDIKEILDQIKVNISQIEEHLTQEFVSEDTTSLLTENDIKILREIDLAILKASFNIDDLIHRMFEGLKKVMDLDVGLILLPYGERLVIRYSTHQEFIGSSVLISKSVTGRAFSGKKILNIPDTSKIAFFFSLVGDMKSEIAVPLFYDDTVIAVLNLESKELNSYSHKHEKLLELMSGQAAVAIKNAQLFDGFNQIFNIEHKILSNPSITQSELFNDVLNIACELINAQYGQLLLYNKEYNKLDIVASTVSDEIGLQVDHTNSVSGKALISKSTIIIDNLDEHHKEGRVYKRGHPESIGEMKSEISVPIIQMSEPVGVLNFESSEYKKFKSYEKYILDLFARQVSTILLNSKIIEVNKQVQAARESTIVSDLSVNWAHNLKNQLGACKMWIQEIRDEASVEISKNSVLKDRIDDIYMELENTLSIPRKIMEMNRFRIEEVKSTNMYELIDNIVNKYDTPRIEFHVDIESDFPILKLPVQFNMVFENAISNSVDAIKDKGDIWIKLETLLSRGGEKRSEARITVRDNGEGIPPLTIDKVGTLGFSTKKGKDATGFGVWWNDNFLKRIGGRWKIKSKHHVGTSVYIDFPTSPIKGGKTSLNMK